MTDHAKYKVVITAGLAWFTLKSGIKPQNASKISIGLIQTYDYEVSIYLNKNVLVMDAIT